jgi:uncharacterized protein YcfJ
MRNVKKWVLVPAVLTALAACGRGDSAKVDEGLKNDLALASQMQPYQPQQYMSPTEMGYNGYAPNGQQYPGMAPQGYYGQPVYQPAPQPVQRATVRRTSTSGARRSSGSSSRVVYREPTIKRNTKRDAVIGAAAGGVLGAVTSRDKVKGAIIGAAAGGVLGGIIGHTVDVQRIP